MCVDHEYQEMKRILNTLKALTSLQLAKCDILESGESDNSAIACALGHSYMIAQGRVSALGLAPRSDGGDVGVRLTCL